MSKSDLQSRLDQAIRILTDIQWSSSDGFEAPWCECPVCGADKRRNKHKDGCALWSLISAPPVTE